MENEVPVPVPLDKLKSILGNAKKLMSVTEQRFPNKPNGGGVNRGNVSENYSQNQQTPMYDERDEREPEYPAYVSQNPSQTNQPKNIHAPMTYDEQMVMNSKLPANIKEAMLKNPIPKLSGPPSKFTLDDLSDLVDKPKPVSKSTGIPLRESTEYNNSPSINITVELLNEMIDKRVNEVLAKMYTKTISEQAIKKTISTLITEGKIKKK